jgi:hypothetical protein
MQYCEEQFLAVAARHGLCRGASAALSLEDVLRLHATPVRIISLARSSHSCGALLHVALTLQSAVLAVLLMPS